MAVSYNTYTVLSSSENNHAMNITTKGCSFHRKKNIQTCGFVICILNRKQC